MSDADHQPLYDEMCAYLREKGLKIPKQDFKAMLWALRFAKAKTFTTAGACELVEHDCTELTAPIMRKHVNAILKRLKARLKSF